MEQDMKKNSTTTIIIVLVVVAVIGGYFYFSSQNNNVSVMVDDEHSSVMEDENLMMDDGTDTMMDDGEAMMDDGTDTMMDGGEAMMESSYMGMMLAGNENSPLLDFNKDDYAKAIASEKLVVLYFYANWCPTCKAEFPKMQYAFDEINSKNLIGFRVNFNDDETDGDEKNLAREFGVAYQHTKVFVESGKRTLKSPESWEKERYLEEITNHLVK